MIAKFIANSGNIIAVKMRLVVMMKFIGVEMG